MKYNRKTFFENVRGKLFSRLSQEQVDGLNLHLNEGERRGLDLYSLAYILATTYHETARTMQPVRETLANSDEMAIANLERAWDRGQLTWVRTPYWRDGWFGRGYVQLTHKRNYELASEKLGVDLVSDPSLAMKPEIAILILFDGMLEGWFTGRALSSYVDGIDDGEEDFLEFVEARRVVNGTDRAKLIAGHAVDFYEALYKAWVVNNEPIKESRTVKGGAAAAGGGALMLVEPVRGVTDALDDQSQALSSGDLLSIFIGAVIVLGAIYVLYARWDDAGRPKPW